MERTNGQQGTRRLGLAASAAVAFLATVAAATPAGALNPIAAKQAQAAALRTQIDQQSMQIGVLAERYNGARVALETAQAQVASAQAGVDAAVRKRNALRATLARRAASLYRGAGSKTPFAQVDPSNMVRTARIAQYGDVTAARDQALIAEVKRSEARLAAQRTAAETARAQAAQQADAANSAYRAASAADRALRSQLAQIDAETKRLIEQQRLEAARAEAARAAEAARIAAAQRAAAEAARRAGLPAPTTTTRPRTIASTGTSGTSGTSPTTTTVSPALTGSPFGPPPAVSPKAAAVVAWARAQIGKPYVFATSGPDSFDCSGLTMAAWGSQGTRLPHYAASQAMMFSKVAYGDLEPGDLVFFYADLHHVGIYIGGGMMVHAPQTGDVVKISSAWRSTFQWGVRPR
ncbi:MAG: NlpC/P60 family protein [Actinomycetes bacterium]